MEIHISASNLPPIPPDWEEGKQYKIYNNITKPIMRKIEPVGEAYYEIIKDQLDPKEHLITEDAKVLLHDNTTLPNSKSSSAMENTDEQSEEETPLLLSSDPMNWKNQDHYAILGLSRLRYRATEEQIRKANRKKILRHHPDKKAALGGDDDDSFFKCIQKATEILLDPVKRRQYDSVDKLANVTPPSELELSKENYYTLWSKVFESEARFSNRQPVPKFGDESSGREEVENFYNFWYNFDSWRTFEYEDEDVADDGENRERKRYVEKKNQNSRKKKKTEDKSRLISLIDRAMKNDERINRFRAEKNARKTRWKDEKEAEARKLAEQEELEKAKQAEAKAAAEAAAAEAAKLERAANKRVKEAAKTAVKKNKRVVRARVKDVLPLLLSSKSSLPTDSSGQYDANAGAKEDVIMNGVELMLSVIEPDDLAMLVERLNVEGDKQEAINRVICGEVDRIVSTGKLEETAVREMREAMNID